MWLAFFVGASFAAGQPISAVIVFTSASVSFLEVTHDRLLNAHLLYGVNDQLPGGRPEPGFKSHLLQPSFDQIVPKAAGALLREFLNPGVESPRDRRLLQKTV